MNDEDMKSATGADNFGEEWTMDGVEAALHIVLTTARVRDNEMERELARALGRSMSAVDWKVIGLASNMHEYRGPNEKPIDINPRSARLLTEYEREPEKVAERCHTSYARIIAGESPQTLSAERRRAEQTARTCQNCFTEFAADGSCMCG